MSEYKRETRDRAQTLADLLDKAQRLAKGIGYGCGATHQLQRAAFVLFAGWGLEELGKAAEGVANDPADWDYAHRTVPRRTRVREDAFALAGDDAASSAGLDVALRADVAEAALSAHLRAFERYQGASIRGDARAASRRSGEATQYAREASSALNGFSGATRRFEETLRLAPNIPTELPLSTPLVPKDLPVEVLAYLYLSGLPMQALERLLPTRTPRVPNLDRLSETAMASELLSLDLEVWEPPALERRPQ